MDKVIDEAISAFIMEASWGELTSCWSDRPGAGVTQSLINLIPSFGPTKVDLLHGIAGGHSRVYKANRAWWSQT